MTIGFASAETRIGTARIAHVTGGVHPRLHGAKLLRPEHFLGNPAARAQDSLDMGSARPRPGLPGSCFGPPDVRDRVVRWKGFFERILSTLADVELQVNER
jgi:hypothetical protein